MKAFCLAVLCISFAASTGGSYWTVYANAQVANDSDVANAIRYSDWDGGCSTKQLGGLSCAMYREARSGAGQRLGFIVFGEEDRSRFLYLEVDLTKKSRSDSSLIATIDGVTVSNGSLICWLGDAPCSTTLVADRNLLGRLAIGRVLAIEDQSHHETILRFPLTDFEQARVKLL